MKHLRSFILFLMLVSLVSVVPVLAQVSFEVPVTVSDGSNTTILYMGVLTPANICIDPLDGFNGHFEAGLPPPPPAGVFDARMIAPLGRPAACYDQGSLNDFRNFSSLAQVDTFRVRQQLGAGTTMTISWPAGLSSYWDVMTLRFFDGSGNVNINMLTSTSVDVTLAGDGAPITIFTTGPNAPPAPGPFFGLSVPSVNFGDVGVGSSSTVQVTVANSGVLNPLNISNIVATPPFSILPGSPIVVGPNGSQIFNVTFTPTVGGLATGNIVFTHDGLAPGPISPTSLPVSGNGTTQGGNLVFAADARTRFDNTDGYQETLELNGYVGAPLKALQLRILTHGLLIVRSVSRGNDIPTPAFNFSSVIDRGPANADGSTNDTIKIVIFGNGTNALPAGSYADLVRFEYDVVNISNPDVQVTTISLAEVLGSTALGGNAGVLADAPQNITVNNRTMRGDVNDDDVIDILDLLLIVDHILNNITLTGDAFTRADVAPWPAGDGVVNVQDLALLQNIILTGQYPDGTPIGRPLAPVTVLGKGTPGGNSTSTLTPGKDVKLTFYITTEGIAVRMENIIAVKGLQLEFGSVPTVAPNVNVTTLLGQGHYNAVNNLLRVLMYNQASEVLEPGDRLVGNIPFSLANPRAVTMDHYVVAGVANNRLENVEIEITLNSAPELPVDYMLFQNYPNPFNPTTSVRFSVPEVSDVRIAVYDLLGQEVQTLFSGQVNRGTRVVEWNGYDMNGRSASSGTYIVRMTAGSFVQSVKMMLVK